MMRYLATIWLLGALPAFAVQEIDVVSGWQRRVMVERSSRDPDARIVVEAVDPPIEENSDFTLIGEGAPGVLRFQKQSKTAIEAIDVHFRTFKKVLRPRLSIAAGTALTPDLFEKIEIETTRGMAQQQQHQMIPESTDLKAYEARWTLGKGQTLVDSQIAKIPLIRRGETLKLRVSTGDIHIMTSARAEQNASIGDVVRVTAVKTKREFSGRLVESGLVEVKL